MYFNGVEPGTFCMGGDRANLYIDQPCATISGIPLTITIEYNYR